MSAVDFALVLKSTIDYYAKQIADSKGLPFVDLDSMIANGQTLQSDQPSVCWDLGNLIEDPRDPLWLVTFNVGAITGLDPAQYVSLDLIGEFVDIFKSGSTFQIMDYSQASMPTQILGTMFVISSAVAPQEQDRAAGVRYVTVTARAVNYAQ